MQQRGSGATRPSVRWGLPDAAIAWVGAFLAGSVGYLVAFGAVGAQEGDDPFAAFAVAAVAQAATLVGVCVWASRTKGLGSLHADFGLVVRPVRDWPALVAGAALELAMTAVLLPLSGLASGDEQTVVEEFQDAGPGRRVFFVLYAVAVAPVVEELLFRGLLQRSLQRRLRPLAAVAISATAFAAVHLVGDPSLGSAVAFPALAAVGVASGVAAVRTGELSQSILLHCGFNLVTVVAILVV